MQVYKHPEFRTKILRVDQWSFEAAMVNGKHHGYSKENNKWARDMWNFLFLDIETYEFKKVQ